MPKLMYIYGDDNRLLECLLSSMRSNGYGVEYANIADLPTAGNIHADLALICTPLTPPTNKVTLGELTLDTDNMVVYNADREELHFTPTEFAMLAYLMAHASRAVSRAELLPAVWGFENDPGSRVADDTVKRLRKKLAKTNVSIDTVWGYGFKARVR